MKTKKSKLLVLALTATLVAVSLITSPSQAAALTGQRGPGGSNGSGYGYAKTGLQAITTLSDLEAEDLQNAIREEYMALNTYQAVLERYPGALPFRQIVVSEGQHVAALIRVAERHGVAVPENSGEVADDTYGSLPEACQMGVELEIADAALYDDLLAGTNNPALIRVYTQLQSASLNNHLPAFEICN